MLVLSTRHAQRFLECYFCLWLFAFFFFFQAEDGIRDLTVTGVQTCALPIYFYDLYRTPDGWGLAVGDVSGKGEEAAAVTAAARYAIRVLARRCADPGEVLAGTNEIVLAEELALDGGFVTASIAHLAWQEESLRVVLGSAGHPPAVVLRSDGRVLMTSGGGLPLGLFPEAEPATQELALDDGDILFLYTDRVAQAPGPDNT